jgi:uncharacterized protein (TIGR00369 family)
MNIPAPTATDLDAARRAARERGDFSQLRERIPYAAFLGVDVSMDNGNLHFRLPFRETLIGNTVLPALHGGVVAGFMENAALLHLLLMLDERRVPKSIDFSIDYLRSANALDTFAACEVARQGRRVAQVQIRCWQVEEGHPGRERAVALARAHFLLSAPDAGD